jgi:hypothetical protein
MKDKFLKIAKVKDEASFYKKYPSEAAFFKAYPEAKKLIKKAQGGGQFSTIQLSDEELNAGDKQPWGDYLAKPNKNSSTMDKIGEGIPVVGNLIKGIQQIGEEKKALQKAQQQEMLTGVQAKASGVKDIDANNVINRNLAKQRNAMFQPINPDELFPTYGVGTNVLAKDGAEIQNTYSFPTTLYSDLGYTPLNDNSQIKQFQNGGEMPYGQIADFANNIFDSTNGGPNAGGNIGGTVGELAGTAFFGPMFVESKVKWYRTNAIYSF